MSNYNSDFLQEIKKRGFIHQSSNDINLDNKMLKKSITAYIGFDVTADSLHIGSLVPLMFLSWLEHYGHKPIALIGGGTTMVGDPSGKDETRKVMDLKTINKNKKSIKKIFKKFVSIDNKNSFMLDNLEWLSKQNYIDFIRDIGKHLTINRMLTYDSVKLRLDREQPLSFLEFNYMILQSYDYYYLNKNHNCILQLGGSDQWGNIINGIDLVRRISGNEVYGLTSPLITTSDGIKMGKTSSGAVWLNKERFSSYDFYQYWRNINDKDVEKFLKLFTYLKINEISKLSKLKGSEINEAKKILAYEVTKICRSKLEADKARDMSNNTFEKKLIDNRFNTKDINKKIITEKKFSITETLVELKLTDSKSNAKRLIKGGGVRINDIVVKDINIQLDLNQFDNDNAIKISCGKKNIGLIKIIK